MPAIVPIAIIGLVGGVLSGLFGIGGGLVIVPALILVAGFPIATAAGTSLAALLLPVGLFGALEYYRAGHVEIQAAAVAMGNPATRMSAGTITSPPPIPNSPDSTPPTSPMMAIGTMAGMAPNPPGGGHDLPGSAGGPWAIRRQAAGNRSSRNRV